MVGWSVMWEHIIKPGKSQFVESQYKTIDRKVAHCRYKWIAYLLYMRGENDLIRKALKKHSNLKLDFFFCDTGEYCGLAEWNIVKDAIKVDGCFAAHDIYIIPRALSVLRWQKKLRNPLTGKCWSKQKAYRGY